MGRLIVFLVSPTQSLQQRLFIIEILLSHPRHADIINYVVKSSLQVRGHYF